MTKDIEPKFAVGKDFNETLDSILQEGFFSKIINMFKSDPPQFMDYIYAMNSWYNDVYNTINIYFGTSRIIYEGILNKNGNEKLEWTASHITTMKLPGYKPYDYNLLNKMAKQYANIAKAIMKDPANDSIKPVKQQIPFTEKEINKKMHNSVKDFYNMFGSDSRRKDLRYIMTISDQLVDYIVTRNKSSFIEDEFALRNLVTLTYVFTDLKNYMMTIMNNWTGMLTMLNNKYKNDIDEYFRKTSGGKQSLMSILKATNNYFEPKYK